MLIPYNEAPFVDKSVASYLEAVWVILAYLDFATLPFPPHELGRKWSQNIGAYLFIWIRIWKKIYTNYLCFGLFLKMLNFLFVGC